MSEDEVVDIEAFEREGREKPKSAKHWRIRIDKTVYTVSTPCMTGRELLTLAGKTPPENYRLMQKLHGGKSDPIGLDQTVCFYSPGVERFLTIPLDQTEGDSPMRRTFSLLDEDQKFLDSTGLQWEAINEIGQQWMLIREYPLCTGYNIPKADAALNLPAGYRDCQIDMVYFYPALARADGKPIGALANLQLDGRVWQRWSRHRTGINPWRPGIDDISTHMRLVDYWLERELKRA